MSKKELLLISLAIFGFTTAINAETNAAANTEAKPVATEKKSIVAENKTDSTSEKPAAFSLSINSKNIALDLSKFDFSFSGLLQSQFSSFSTKGANSKNQNGFSIRRALLTAKIKVSDEWSGNIGYEFDSSTSGNWGYNDYLNSAFVEYKNSYGKLRMGLQKNRFMIEEYTSAGLLPCIERSINSNYIASNNNIKGLASHHIGIFWEGIIDKSNFYGVSLTNATSRDYNSNSNDLCVTLNYSHIENVLDGKMTIGANGIVNFGNDGTPNTRGTSTVLTNGGAVYGIEPYLKFERKDGLSILLDSYIISGDGDSEIHRTFGVNGTAAYRLSNNLEPVVRATYMNSHTDAYGVNASLMNRVPASGNLPKATSYYAGANYYIGKYIKLSSGLEYIHTFGGDNKTDSTGFRAQVQLSF